MAGSTQSSRGQSLTTAAADVAATMLCGLLQAALAGDRTKAAALLRLAYQNYTLPPYHLLREYSGYNFGASVLPFSPILHVSQLCF